MTPQMPLMTDCQPTSYDEHQRMAILVKCVRCGRWEYATEAWLRCLACEPDRAVVTLREGARA